MTDDKNKPKDFQGADVGDSHFDTYDKTKTYVRITENNRQAWLYLCPKTDGSRYTKNELIELLKENEVVAGLNDPQVGDPLMHDRETTASCLVCFLQRHSSAASLRQFGQTWLPSPA